MMFSICIPVYNAENFLKDCINSVLNQSYQLFEMILVDDGSKDRSFSICKDYAQKDRRIKCFTKKNEGQLATRLFAFSKVQGDFVVCLDSDDFLEQNALEILLNYFTKYDCDCIYFGLQRFCGKRIIGKNIFCEEVKLLETPRIKYKEIFFNSNYNSMCLKAIKSNVLPQNDYSLFYNLRMAEDLIQSVDIIKNCKNVLIVPDVLYNYRINPLSVTENVCLNNCDVNDVARSFVFRFLTEEAVFTERDWAEYGFFCNDLFFNDIMKIVRFPNSLRNRLYLLQKKRNSEYYKNFVSRYSSSNLIRSMILFMFNKKFMIGVLFLSFILNSLIKIKKLSKVR